MCEFAIENKCKIDQNICPWMYWCDKLQIWRPNKYMPKNCNVKNNVKSTKGKYKVRDYRKNFLYVDIGDITYKLLNPFDFIPDYVDVEKRNGVYKVKKRGLGV